MQSNSMLSMLKNMFWGIKVSFVSVPWLSTGRFIFEITDHLSGLIYSYVAALLIDSITKYLGGNANFNVVNLSLGVFFGYLILHRVTRILDNYISNNIGFYLSYSVHQNLLAEKLSRLSTATLESPKTQNLVSRYQDNSWIIDDMSRKTVEILGILSVGVVAISATVMILPVPTIIFIFVSIPSFFYSRHMVNKLWKLDQDLTEIDRKGMNMMEKITDPESMMEVRIVNGFNYLKRYFDEYMSKYVYNRSNIYKNWAIADFLSDLLQMSLLIYVIFQLVGLVELEVISLGSIIFYISAFRSVGSFTDNLGSNLAGIAGLSGRATDARELLEMAEEESTENKVSLPKLETPPMIEINNLTFSYAGNEREVLHGLNLKINPGEKIALVGENGAGKTTLIKLLSNIYPATSGEILINGQNLNEISQKTWFQNLGVLYQNFNQYSALTVRENIGIGQLPDTQIVEFSTDPKHSEMLENAKNLFDDKRIEDAIHKSDAQEFIHKYEKGFDTILSERYEGGIRPSTGQWQKIAIARFFYRNAPVLILDEPTAAIDAVAEANIFNRIYEFIEGKTVIIVSHRFSTVRNADRIIVLDEGRVAEEGSHDELMALNGKYAHAFRLQAEGYQDQ